MKTVDVKLVKFKEKTWLDVDRSGHIHPSKKKMSQITVIEIVTDGGFTGRYPTVDNHLAPSGQYSKQRLTNLYNDNYIPMEVGDSLWDAVEKLEPVLIGEGLFCWERIYQKLSRMQRLGGSVPILDEIVGAINCALRNLAGRCVNLSVYKLLSDYRTRVPAYGSIMVEDDYRHGLTQSEGYGTCAKQLKSQEYQDIKFHT